MDFLFIQKALNIKKFGKEIMNKIHSLETLEEKIRYMDSIGADYWIPSKITYPEK